MTSIVNVLVEYLNHPFIRYALIVGVLIALCSSLLGVTLVLKRYSFIGDGLSHVAFGALSIATVLRIYSDMLVVLPITIICAMLLLCSGRNSKIKGDSALAMISVGTLAAGYMLMNIFPASSNINGDVCGTLFGSNSILALSTADVWICAIMSVVVIAFYIFYYDKIFAITFDESFAETTGIRVKLYNLILSILCAVIIVLSMNLVGSLLTSALIVFPAVSAMRIFKSFKGVSICAAFFSVVCALTGIIISILASTPIGATIVVTELFAFIAFYLIGKIIVSK